MEAVKVIDKYGSLTHPLTVELAPESLAPAGIGDSEVETVGVGVLPVACSNVVTEGVLIAVEDKLGIARSTRAEEDEHGVCAAGSVLCALEVSAVSGELCVEVVPALTLTVYQYLCFQCGRNRTGEVHLICHIAVSCADDSRYLSGVEAVLEVVLLEHI